MNSQSVTFDDHFNESETETHNSPLLHTRLIFASAWIIIAVAGILGNGLVIYVAIRFQKMINVTNCFIVNLAVTDIVFLAFCMPLLVAQYTLEHWLFNEIICKLMNFISFVSVLVTVLTLVAMTIDRYIYVVRPFQNLKWRKPKTILLLSIIIWLISCMFASPFYHSYVLVNTSDNYHECVLRSEDDVQQYFRIYIVTLYYFIPLTIIIICYTLLLYYVYSKENKLKPKTKHSVVKWSKKRRAVTKMVAIVTLVFAICWLPITLYIMSSSVFSEKTRILYYFKVIANSFAYLNSAINPILYAFLNRSFRNNCGSLFSEPTCSLFCADEYQSPPKQERKQPQLQPPEQKFQPPVCSTQIDRFSYQSTNRQSSSTNQKKKINKRVSIKSQVKQVTVDDITHRGFSDTDYEKSDDEYGIQTNPETNVYSNLLPSQKGEITSQIDNIQTTSF
ncbi:hypothetical protein I4U23_014702 [Adineta vaga]|nr:hypothetical protein I4U23_014702 [Adineta vaga]